jgi:undecaprenyl diphosphate synthase
MSQNDRMNADRGLHVAILPDGNGRWAASRGLPRSEGHRAGAAAVRRVIGAAPALGIGTLTFYAFSANNWERPVGEVRALLAVLEGYLRDESAALVSHGVRLRVLGRRDRIPASMVEAIEIAERVTCNATTARSLELRIAIDYSARESILQAACWMLSSVEISDREFSRRLGQVTHGGSPAPDVDLLIRTGGERRLSDFLLWECAYAELLFTPVMWPEFHGADLEAAVEDFLGRERRFGRLPETAAAS